MESYKSYDKSCDFGEYLDYENCKCRIKLNDKVVKECSENVLGNEMIYNEKVPSSCRIYIALFFIAFLIIICFSSAFVFIGT